MDQRNSPCIKPDLFLGLSGTALKVQKKARVIVKKEKNLDDNMGGYTARRSPGYEFSEITTFVLLLQRQIRCLGT